MTTGLCNIVKPFQLTKIRMSKTIAKSGQPFCVCCFSSIRLTTILAFGDYRTTIPTFSFHNNHLGEAWKGLVNDCSQRGELKKVESVDVYSPLFLSTNIINEFGIFIVYGDVNSCFEQNFSHFPILLQ